MFGNNSTDMWSMAKSLMRDFHDFTELRLGLRGHLLDDGARRDVADALAYMDAVANDPMKYLSRAKTQSRWFRDIHNFAVANNLNMFNPDDKNAAILSVPTPVEWVMGHVKDAFYDDAFLHDEYIRACRTISYLDYEKTSKKPDNARIANLTSTLNTLARSMNGLVKLARIEQQRNKAIADARQDIGRQ